MDIYALTRKKRPTHLTLGQSTTVSRPPLSTLDTIESPTLTEQSSVDSKQQSLNSASSFSEPVTGPPSRHHWKPDADSTHCAQFGCGTAFGLFERRHHCRKCGDIFCSDHCAQSIRLDQSSRFHPKGILSRCCNGCANDYRRWLTGLQDTHEQQQQDHDHGKEKHARRRTGIMTHQPHAMEGVTELGRDDIVEANRHPIAIKSKHEVAFNPIPSVPADWQWSTF
ncbi:hypothetical protein K492DRAFT_162359 [Lichtheimia hyalospora FSU 10163]|nr:hypothetical protein K492DRAFT_162359 [Lichtheimia hyalospora FSU 10163]